MEISNDGQFMSLMGDISNVPKAYISQIANIKRVLERWVSDPKYREEFEIDAAKAIASLKVDVKKEEITPLIYEEEAMKFVDAYNNKEWDKFPLSTFRYKAFFEEKKKHRTFIREESRSSNLKIDAWRHRQINRCAGVLGLKKAEALVHAPAAFEISNGCSVGCWFCGVTAPKFEHNWPYNAENAAFWKGSLQALKDVMGACVKNGFMYWATDPLDNPDYEKFLKDFHTVTGRCPQTTTAMGTKDLDRTRALFNLSASLGSDIDRFSVLSLKMLSQIHEYFTPEELLRVECIPQNKEAKDRYVKANAGRARDFTEKKQAELTKEKDGSTIACVSGFLFNMARREVRLVTPCTANEKWPLGYWVIDKRTFDSPEALKAELESMVDKHMRIELELGDRIRLRKDISWEVDGDDFKLISDYLKVTFYKHKNPTSLLNMLEQDLKIEDIALRRMREDQVEMAETFFMLNELFRKGFLNEEPEMVKINLPVLTPA